MDCFDLIGKEELHVDMTVCHKKYKYYYDIHGLIIYWIVWARISRLIVNVNILRSFFNENKDSGLDNVMYRLSKR